MFSEYLNHIRSLGNRYFTFDQIINDLKISPNSAKSGLHRMKAEGRLISPAKGLYVLVPPQHQPQGSIPADELVPILMDYLKADYYVSLLSAAQYHGASHQKPNRFQVVLNKRLRRNLQFGHVRIDLIYKKSLDKLPTQNFVVSTGYLKVASPELVAFDLLSYPEKSGGLNHIATVLYELIEAMDDKKLIELAEIVGQKAWLQRLGYILEQLDTMDEAKKNKIIDSLLIYLQGKIKVYVPLTRQFSRSGHTRITRWKIIANREIESDL